MNVDLNLATNWLGTLDGEVRARLMAAIQQPSEETWDNAYSICINGEGIGLTLWQAVLKVDPGFAEARGPVRRLVKGRSELMSG